VGRGEIELFEMPVAAFTPLPETGGLLALTLALCVDELDGERHWPKEHGARILLILSLPQGSADELCLDKLPVRPRNRAATPPN
jgi:hypothetical protein